MNIRDLALHTIQYVAEKFRCTLHIQNCVYAHQDRFDTLLDCKHVCLVVLTGAKIMKTRQETHKCISEVMFQLYIGWSRKKRPNLFLMDSFLQ